MSSASAKNMEAVCKAKDVHNRTCPWGGKGTHVHLPEVTVRRAKVVRLESPGVIAYADGERLAPLPVTCTCVPGALTVLAPE